MCKRTCTGAEFPARVMLGAGGKKAHSSLGEEGWGGVLSAAISVTYGCTERKLKVDKTVTVSGQCILL